MNARIFNIGLLFIWLTVGVGLLFRNSFLAEEYRTPEWKSRLDLVMIGSFILAAWNLMRLGMQPRSRSPRPPREGIAGPSQQPREKPKVINPEFDFSKPDTPPEPPLNGKHR
jgi:hypothetical protein